MDERPSRAQSCYEGYPERMKVYKEHRAKTLFEAKISPLLCKNHSDNFQVIRKIEKSLEKKTLFENEGFKIFRAMSLALSILTLCYYGLTEYHVLQNGYLHRSFPPRKIPSIVTFSFGYSVSYSIISAVTVGMLVYSIIMKRPQFSLPFIGFFLNELMCDVCDVIITSWYLFEYLQIHTALLYTAGLLLLILTETWTWLGVVWLYEHRNLETH